MRRRVALVAVLAAVSGTVLVVPSPPAARAASIPAPVCTVAGWFSGLAGTLCSAARDSGRLLGAGSKLLGGHLGGAAATLTGAGTAAKTIGVTVVLAGIVGWVTAGARAVISATARVIGATTRPQLQSSWFSSSYWRMAAIALLLTIPFLFAACVQAILRADPSLLARAALGYLPLAVLGTMIAAPVVTLLLAVSDGMTALIAGAAGNAPGVALSKFAVGAGTVSVFGGGFVALVIGFITVAAGLTLWFELLIRAAAVYVIVLMLPMVFAALVWPARRVWAARTVELLIALILSKFVIVAVLSLGSAAVGSDGIASPVQGLAGTVLMLMAAFSPWALLRLLPMHELAAGVDGLRSHVGRALELPERQGPADAADAAPQADVAGPAETSEPSAVEAMVAGLPNRAQIARAAGSGPDAVAAPAHGAAVTVPGPVQGTVPGPSADAGDDVVGPEPRAARGPAASGEGGAADRAADGAVAPRPAELAPDEYDRATIEFGTPLRFGPPEPGGFVPRAIEDGVDPSPNGGERAADTSDAAEPPPVRDRGADDRPGPPPAQDHDGDLL